MTFTNCGSSGHNIKTCPKLKDLASDMESGGDAGRLKDRSRSFLAKGGLVNHPETGIVAEREVQKMKKLEDMCQKLSPGKVGPVLGTNSSGAAGSSSADLPSVPELPPSPGGSKNEGGRVAVRETVPLPREGGDQNKGEPTDGDIMA